MNGECIARLTAIGISVHDAYALRRIAMTLHRWHEMECGVGNGCVERDEETGKVFWHNAMTGQRTKYPDYERPALKRLAATMAGYPELTGYVQGDPRGAALFILRQRDLADGTPIDCCYSRGVAVYK